MDWGSPIGAVVPGAYGPVLVAVVRAGAPMSGRQIAALVDGRVSRSRVNSVLGELAGSGLVLAESHPPAILYRFNRDHVAAPQVEALVGLRQLLLDRMRDEVGAWDRPAVAVWLFGSAARGEGSVSSDVDVLVVRPDALDEGDPVWRKQLTRFAARVEAWSGNLCEVLELSRSDLVRAVDDEDRLTRELREDAVHIGGAEPSAMLRQHGRRRRRDPEARGTPAPGQG